MDGERGALTTAVRLAAAATVAAVACSQPSAPGSPPAGEERSPNAHPKDREEADGQGGEADEGAPAPPKLLRVCDKSPSLRPACPRLVPRIKASQARTGRFRPAGDYQGVSVEWGVQASEGVTRANAPNRFAHLTLQAGSTGRAFPFPWPAHDGRPRFDGKLRRAATLLGRPLWAGRRGDLALAPSYPFGGVNGDHLIFRWAKGGRDYAVSLHAWIPLAEARSALRDLVESISS